MIKPTVLLKMRKTQNNFFVGIGMIRNFTILFLIVLYNYTHFELVVKTFKCLNWSDDATSKDIMQWH